MIIKKYIADTVEEANKMVLEELGPEAITLGVRKVQAKGLRAFFSSPKMEVTVAIEEEDLKQFNQNKYPKKKLEKAEKEVDELAEVKALLQRFRTDEDEPKLVAAPREMPKKVAETKVRDTATYADPRFARKKTPTPVNRERERVHVQPEEDFPIGINANKRKQQMEAEQRSTSSLTEVSKGLVERFREQPEQNNATRMDDDSVRRIIREEMRQAQGSVSIGQLDHDDETPGSVRFLIRKGLDRGIALDIEKVLSERFGELNLKNSIDDRKKWMSALKHELAKRVPVSGPITFRPGKPTIVALVGATGVGKTSTLVKIASQYVQDLGKRVGIISLDNSKVGAREQIRGLCDRFNLPHEVATTSLALQRAVQSFADCDLILVDTAGRSQYHWQEVDDLGTLLHGIEEIQILLVLSATTKDVDAMGAVDQFSRLNISGLVFTKLDETITHGLLINIATKTRIPLTYLTTGPQIPRDIKIADAQEIARTLLLAHNSAECRRIRSLISA
ncbi:MAG: hypothetical protein CMO81_05855 [Waddliaceae bacterium]|nr:hypothetical protein [Waddliaceae bacterium]